MTPLLLTLSAALGADIVAPGICDASAAALVDGALLVTNDEDASLHRYTLTGQPIGRVALGADDVELDLEGAALSGERVWWTGSLGNNKRGEPRPERGLLIATSPGGEALGRVELREPLLAYPATSALLSGAAALPPKAGGLNVEGLAADPSGRLWLGLRSPLDARGRAALIRLDAPAQLLTGASPVFSAVELVDLGGRGVRSLTWWSAAGAWLILAGPTDGDGDFALYRWAGAAQAPSPVAADLSGFSPEGMEFLPSGELLLLSDDGRVDRSGRDCKDRWKDDPADPEVYFRMRVLTLTL